MRYQGRHVLITGAANGIGRAVALRIASEGGTLALIDQDGVGLDDTAHAATALGATVHVRECDVAGFDAVATTIEQLDVALGGIHAVSHNAGVLRAHNTHEMTLDQWERLVSVNLTGTFCVNRHVLPRLLRHERSYLCNMSSIAAFHPHPWLAAYAATKGAIQAFTRSLFIEYHRQGLRANCVQPGSVRSGLASAFTIPEGADPDLVRYLVPYGEPHMVGPEHVASVIAMLCCDDAFHINGAEIVVDGGRI